MIEFAASLDPNKRYVFSHKKIEKIDSTLNGQGIADWKPQGLWYSFGNEWLEHLSMCIELGEKWAKKRLKIYKFVYQIDIHDEHILHLRTKKRIKEFTDRNGIWVPTHSRKYEYPYLINWRDFASRWYGVEMDLSQRKWELDFLWLSKWDIISGCIFDNRAIKEITLVWSK